MIPIDAPVEVSTPEAKQTSLRQLAVDIQLSRVICSDDFFGPKEPRDFRRLKSIFLGLLTMPDDEILKFQKRCPFIYQYKNKATHMWEGKEGEKRYYFDCFESLTRPDAEELYKILNALDPKTSFFDVDPNRLRREIWGNDCSCTFTKYDDLLLSHFVGCEKFDTQRDLTELLSNLVFAFDEFINTGVLTLETKKLMSRVFAVFGFMDKAKFHV